MRTTNTVFQTLLALSALTPTALAARKPSNAVQLSDIQSLTLRAGQKTSHRRVPAVDQLKCIGGAGCAHYTVDLMRCKNSGSSYSSKDVEWTCSASLPPEFKLGSTDVICEGYEGPDDEYVLKGSCAVEYRLLLTDLGEEKFGSGWWGGSGKDNGNRGGPEPFTVLFWVFFLCVVGFMIYKAFFANDAGNRRLGGGGGGWGGGGGGGDDNDPPPPYSYHAPRPKPGTSTSSWTRNAGSSQQGWQPGFWTGAMGGAAAGYLAGNRDQRNQTTTSTWGSGGSSFWGGGDRGEGSSSGRNRPSSSSSPSYSSSRYESTGFGSSSRR